MRTRLPTSQAALRFRISIFDFVCIVVSPLLALYLGESYVLGIAIDKHEQIYTVVFYCVTWITFSLVFFFALRLYDGLAHHFSVHDALDVVKAVLFTELSTCVVFFTYNRLQGIPRSGVIIHALLLTAGLVGSRLVAQAFHKDAKGANGRNHAVSQNIILIGATRMSALYAKLVDACFPGAYRVIAILDGRAHLIGRSMSGIRILTAPHQLDSVIEEFIVHGVDTDQVIIGEDSGSLGDEELTEIRRVCEHRQIRLDYLPHLIGLAEPPHDRDEPDQAVVEDTAVLSFEVPRYLKYRQVFDFFAALTIIVVVLPLLIASAVLTLLDFGSPVLFWQQRIGQGGRRFMLQKFRTLPPPYDWRGRPIPDRKQLSLVGKLLRQTRLDELPQLLNVLVGDMALIGPRPLLPEDQPLNPATRLMVRPGITGWAQVNGGKFLTPEQKDQYDEYYIRNASLWFDLRIVFMTLRVLFRFGGRSDYEVAASQLVGFGKTNDNEHAKTETQRPTKAPARRIESPFLNPASQEGSLRASSMTDRQASDGGRRRSVK